MSSDLRAPPVGYWALAPVLATLRRELLVAFPSPPTSLYGTIGDPDHAARNSDHNPDANRYVRALDVPNLKHTGPPLDRLAEFIRQVGATQSQRLAVGGYVIWNRRTASARSRWQWVTYMGENPHTTHLHVSCSRLPHYYCIGSPWNVAKHLL